jgi:predicted ATP-binding protein involved in virulence
MNIKSLRVQNFKCFEDKSFEFSEGFNLIVGDNGTGKTAVLDALQLAVANYFAGLKMDFPVIEKRLVRVTKHEFENTNTFESQYPCHVTAEANIFLSSQTQEQTFPQSVDFSQSAYEESWGLVTPKGMAFTNQIRKGVQNGEHLTLPVISSYSTARLWLKKQDLIEKNTQPLLFDPEVTTPSSRLDGYKNALDVAISNKSWLKWFMRMELISLQERKPLKTFEAVKQAVQTCLESCDLLYFDVKRGEPVARIQGNLLPFSLLSDGQRSMLAMVADIAYRMAQLNPHLVENVALETPGVVLIDELDLHLHPKWQRKVVDNLRRAFPKVQFFATSHSPFIIQSLQQNIERPDKLIDLNGIPTAFEYQDKSIEDIAEMVQGVEMPQQSYPRLRMLEAAREYYTVLEQAKDAEGEKLEQLKTKLDELSMPFSNDMAYHAFLEMERLAALKEKA